MALADVAQLVGALSGRSKVHRFNSWSCTYPGYGFDPWSGCIQEGNESMSLTLSFPLSLSLSVSSCPLPLSLPLSLKTMKICSQVRIKKELYMYTFLYVISLSLSLSHTEMNRKTCSKGHGAG